MTNNDSTDYKLGVRKVFTLHLLGTNAIISWLTCLISLIAFILPFINSSYGEVQIHNVVIFVIVLLLNFCVIGLSTYLDVTFATGDIVRIFRNTLIPKHVNVINEGEIKRKSTADLKLFDVVTLNKGDVVPTDIKVRNPPQRNSLSGNANTGKEKKEASIIRARSEVTGSVLEGTVISVNNLPKKREFVYSTNTSYGEFKYLHLVVDIIGVTLAMIFMIISLASQEVTFSDSLSFTVGILITVAPTNTKLVLLIILTLQMRRIKRSKLVKICSGDVLCSPLNKDVACVISMGSLLKGSSSTEDNALLCVSRDGKGAVSIYNNRNESDARMKHVLETILASENQQITSKYMHFMEKVRSLSCTAQIRHSNEDDCVVDNSGDDNVTDQMTPWQNQITVSKQHPTRVVRKDKVYVVEECHVENGNTIIFGDICDIIHLCSSFLNAAGDESDFEEGEDKKILSFCQNLNKRGTATWGVAVSHFEGLHCKDEADEQRCSDTKDRRQKISLLYIIPVNVDAQIMPQKSFRDCQTNQIKTIVMSEENVLLSYSLGRRTGLIQMDDPKLYVKDGETERGEMNKCLMEQLNTIQHCAKQFECHYKSDAIISSECLNSFNKARMRDMLNKHNVIMVCNSGDEEITKMFKLLGKLNVDTISVVSDTHTLKTCPTYSSGHSSSYRQGNRNITMASGDTAGIDKTTVDVICLTDIFSGASCLINQSIETTTNIKRALNVSLSSVIPCSIPFIASAVGGIPASMSHGLVLCVNFIINIILAIGVSNEKIGGMKCGDNYDNRKHIHNTLEERVITGGLCHSQLTHRFYKLLLVSHVWNGLMSTLLCYASFMFVMWQEGMDLRQIPHGLYNEQIDIESTSKGLSSYLLTLVCLQITFCLLCKTKSQTLFRCNTFHNKFGLLTSVIALLFTLVLIYVPWSNELFGTSPIPFVYCISSLVLPFFMFYFDEIRKLCMRKFYSSCDFTGVKR